MRLSCRLFIEGEEKCANNVRLKFAGEQIRGTENYKFAENKKDMLIYSEFAVR